jgi:hypothetical protein
MKMIDQYDMGKTFEIPQTRGKLRVKHDSSLNATGAGRLNRNSLDIFVRGMDNANRSIANYIHYV